MPEMILPDVNLPGDEPAVAAGTGKHDRTLENAHSRREGETSRRLHRTTVGSRCLS